MSLEFVAQIEGIHGRGTLALVDELTPYAMETVSDYALYEGHGTRVTVTVPPGASDAVLAWVRERLVRLGTHGLDVSIGREEAESVAAAAARKLSRASQGTALC
jgi:hypothetical protein